MMVVKEKSQRTLTKFAEVDHLETWLEGFMVDRKVQGMSPGTIGFYNEKLAKFLKFCDSQLITQVTEITPQTIREYLLALDKWGHNPGGIHAHYRAVRTFLNWWEDDVEPEGWKNPIRKVKAPRVGIEPLEPADIGDIKRILAICKRGEFTGDRDRAIILTLLDTGARAQELLDMDLDDLDLVLGSILIRHGKGRKPRTVYISKPSRKAIRAYLKSRIDNGSALWVSRNGERLKYMGLRSMIRRRAESVGVDVPKLHGFRRLCALTCLRRGVDIFSLQRLMGHSDLQVLRRYLAQADSDLKNAHAVGSPVEELLGG
ncbi:MAG: tyrosine-type recombinase/integrase [Anaerolineales bacterium]|nr:tyrosine-type recombinase/integrase [Anaerolineales bacterium]